MKPGLFTLRARVGQQHEPAFARVLARLLASRFRISPTDHIVWKAIYRNDPDGIGLELTLETPEHIQVYRWDDAGTDVEIIDTEGRRRGGGESLDVLEVLATLPDDDISQPLAAGTRVGHLHLHGRGRWLRLQVYPFGYLLERSTIFQVLLHWVRTLRWEAWGKEE